MFGGSVNVHPPMHTIAVDGVFEKTDHGVRFHEAPPRSKDDVPEVAKRVRDRALRWLRRRGYPDERAAEELSNEVAEPSTLIRAAAGLPETTLVRRPFRSGAWPRGLRSRTRRRHSANRTRPSTLGLSIHIRSN